MSPREERRAALQRWGRRLGKVALWVLGSYCVWLILAFALQRRIVFPRHVTRQAAVPGAGVPRLQRRWMQTDQGKVESWFAPAPRASTVRPASAVIYAHGNGELIDGQGDVVRGYHRLGLSVLLVEFRGYGRSAGSPSQQRIVADHVKGYDWLTRRGDVDRQRIVFHGRSLGTGVVCALAAKRKPAALILLSPFRSIRRMMAWYLIPGFAVRDPFDSESVLRRFRRPVLLLHGTSDRVVPYRHSRALHRITPRSTLRTYPSGHNDFPVTSERYWTDIADHLRRAGVLPRSKSKR